MSHRNKRPEGMAALAAAGLPCLLLLFPVLLRGIADFALPAAREEFIAAFTAARTWKVLGFSLFQAGISAASALVLGFPAAYLCAHFEFPGKRILKALFSLPFVIPSLLLVLGLAGFLGNAGIANAALSSLGLPKINFIYGLQGVILAHAFFNFPIAARLVESSLSQSDQSLGEAALLLGAGRFRRFLTIRLPEALPGILSAFFLIFLFCLQSFTVVLLLGGGPRYSTLEVEIYQAMRLTFQPGQAACFAFLELAASLCLTFLYALSMRGRTRISRHLRPRSPIPPEGPTIVAGAAYLVLVFLILGGPLLSILAQAAGSRLSRLGKDAPGILSAAALTLSTGFAAAAIACALGILSANAASRSDRPSAFLACAVLPMAVSPLVLARSLSSLSLHLPPLPILVLFHAALALPIATQTAYSAFMKIPKSLEEAAVCLGAPPLKVLLTVKVPIARRALVSAFFFSFCISAGDLSGILSLRVPGLETLSLRVYRLAGAYRFADACAVGVILMAISLVAFAFREEG